MGQLDHISASRLLAIGCDARSGPWDGVACGGLGSAGVELASSSGAVTGLTWRWAITSRNTRGPLPGAGGGPDPGSLRQWPGGGCAGIV